MDLAVLRDDMVEGLEHPSKAAVESEAVSVAMRAVPRHEFVPAENLDLAYADRPLPIGAGQTISQPYIVAYMTEAVEPGPDERVGAGVGYTAAVVAEIVGAPAVSAIDLSRPLVYDARRNLAGAGYGAVLVDCRDGADGLPEYAPFDRILVEAAAVEPPRALLSQLADDGRLVMPLGYQSQDLVAFSGPEVEERFGPVRFTPLLVDGEQAGGIERNRTMREERERAERAAERRRGWEQDWIDWDSTP